MIVSEKILVQSCQRTLLQTSDLGIARFARFNFDSLEGDLGR